MGRWIRTLIHDEEAPRIPVEQDNHLVESQERLARALSQQAEVTRITETLSDHNQRNHYIERLIESYGRPTR